MEGAPRLSTDRAAEVIPIRRKRADLDEAEVAQVKQGDRRAFPKIIERHQQAVYAFCLRTLQEPAQARDAAQEVFLTFWRERARYEHQGKLRVYLLTIARFRCLALLKKQKGQARLVQHLEQPAPNEGAFEALVKREAGKRVLKALSRIDEERAELIRLRYLEGLNMQEIAKVTGLKPGTIKSRLHRGLAQLKEELSDVR